MQSILGDFINIFPPEHDSLELIFTPNSERIKKRWRNQRLSAHFAADYFVNFLPTVGNNLGDDEEQRVRETKGAVSFVANELLENAMKFNLENSTYKVKFGIHFLKNSQRIAVIYAINYINLPEVEKFQAFIHKLQTSDLDELYMEQIEAGADDEDAEASGLGFLTMINDYQAKLGWKFETIASESDIVAVTSMAQVTV